MRVPDIQSLFDYNTWANQRLLAAAADLSSDELTATTRFPRASIRGSSVHIQSAVRFHLSQWDERSPRPRLDDDQFPDVAAIAAQLERDEEELRVPHVVD